MAIVPRVLVVLCAGWLAVWQLHAMGVPAVPTGPVKWVHLVVMAVGAGLCFARAAAERRERLAWTLIGAGLTCWILGETYFTLVLWNDASPPVPSPADIGYLLLPPLLFAGIALLLRERVRGLPRMLWVDGVTSALAVGAVSAAVVLQQVLDAVGGDRLAVATNLAYPIADLILLGFMVGALAAGGWRGDRTQWLLMAGVTSFWLSDSIYLVLTAKGTWVSGGPFDAGWWATAVFFGAAAWQPVQLRAALARPSSTRAILTPVTFALLGLGVLVAGSVGRLNGLAIVLAAASLVAVMGRLILTYRENLAMLDVSREEALTDSLTGLGNRRSLTTDLERAFEGPDARRLLAIFDLDGFKHYNDSFGHPAGDTLLQRLGASLAERVDGRGTAYRMGGDEFCVLLDGPDEVLLAGCAAALHESGEGFGIGCSHGAVVLGDEADDPSDALRIADKRLYAGKRSGRPSIPDEAKEVMLRILAESDPELGTHVGDVADLAERVALALDLSGEEVRHVRLAAELHDVGKVAIPDEILRKPGPLDDGEWEFMRRHTLIGERIITASPGLAPVAAMVRSSHERWDGSGYPDGLAGDDIPLGARIVAVCDAYDAMTKDRAYRSGMDPQAAVQELHACAGSQFDPRVVAAFEHALRESVARRAA
ncbi:MAG TPA: HD domain-containing phosphohydrolase [Solirubrobacteraceae bacterium]